MKPLRIEFNLFNADIRTTAGVEVYNTYENGEPVFQKTIDCTGEPNEVIAYILKKYVINHSLEWHKVAYNENRGAVVLYGYDKRTAQF